MNLTSIPAKMVKPPLIEECIGHLECKVVQSHVCGDHTLFVGEVLSARVNDDILSDGNFNPLKAKPIIQKNHVYFTITDKKN